MSGLACAKYMLGSKMTKVSLAALTNGGLSGKVVGSKLAGNMPFSIGFPLLLQSLQWFFVGWRE